MSSCDAFSTHIHTHKHTLPNKHINYYRGQIVCFSGLSMGGTMRKKNTDKRTKEPQSWLDIIKKTEVSEFLTLLLFSCIYEDLPSFFLSWILMGLKFVKSTLNIFQ